MKFSDFDPAHAAEFVAQFEGLSLKAYRCPAGVLTIGYGHTGADVYEGQSITKDEALHLLADDLRKHFDAIKRMITVEVTENQCVALLSFAFNVGATNFQRSSVRKNLNRGAPLQAAESFLLWNRAGGKVLPGLTRRRNAERRLFLKP
jgi:lysozyme